MKTNQPAASPVLVIVAFAIVWVVWGSTYFFIQVAIHGFPPMLMGAVRFLTAGILMLIWCAIKGDKIWSRKDIITSGISGFLMLFIGMGIVIWTEQSLPSAMVAIMVSTNPIWFVALDKDNWKVNLKSKSTISGLILGFGGVFLLFGEAIFKSSQGAFSHQQLIALLLLLIGPIGWCTGSLVSKKSGSTAPARLNTAWQMVIAGILYIFAGAIHNEIGTFHPTQIPLQAWLAVGYLIVFGSIFGFSAYVWLLSVRPATQVSTHSYVNPVIAVLLGTFFGNEHISTLQLIGLFVILFSVLLVNLTKYSFKKSKPADEVLAEAK